MRITQAQSTTLERLLLKARLDEGHREDVDIKLNHNHLILTVPWQRKVILIDEEGKIVEKS